MSASTHTLRLDRRRFLGSGLSLAGACALAARGALSRGDGQHRTLVLLELTGGNDGLSTVVPYGDDAYHRLRPSLRRARNDVLAIDDYRGLHPSLRGLRALYDAGQLSIVEGVGYPDAPRSHFRSMEIWHAGDPRGRAVGTGWIGRLCERAWRDERATELVVHVGPSVPFSLASAERPPIALESPTAYRWFGAEAELEAYRAASTCEDESESVTASSGDDSRASGRDAALARIRGVLARASDSSQRVREAIAAHQPAVEYPRERLAGTLQDIAALVHAGLGARVLSTNLAGFDTHAGQAGAHDALMRKLDQALAAFVADLAQSEAGRATVVLAYSEFGRRVAENASQGTDHGRAGPVLVLGPAVRGGLYGRASSLDELDDGDLAFTTDFRSVYATLIERWLGASAAGVLGGEHALLDFV